MRAQIETEVMDKPVAIAKEGANATWKEEINAPMDSIKALDKSVVETTENQKALDNSLADATVTQRAVQEDGTEASDKPVAKVKAKVCGIPCL